MKFTIEVELRLRYTNKHKTSFYDVYAKDSHLEKYLGELLVNPKHGTQYRNANLCILAGDLENFLKDNFNTLVS